MTLKSGIMAMGVGTALLLCGCAGPHNKPAKPPRLVGAVQGYTYSSTQGGFSVPFPVTADLNGRIQSDSAQSVTFIDNWGSHITFSGEAVLEQSPIMSMVQTQGKEKALTEFARRSYGDLIAARYLPEVREGLLTFIYLRPASPKTAVAIFIHGRRIFVVETAMLPGLELLAQSDEKSQLERELWLEDRAVDLAKSMEAR
jgi:hypothetical protein